MSNGLSNVTIFLRRKPFICYRLVISLSITEIYIVYKCIFHALTSEAWGIASQLIGK